MRASICIAVHDKPNYLRRVLASIFRQAAAGDPLVETIVVDDRSQGKKIYRVCREFPSVRYLRLDGEPGYRNPSRARNVAYRAARGEVIVAQSADVVHVTDNCIERLILELAPGTFVIGRVWNTDFSGNVVPLNLQNPTFPPITLMTDRRPFFFLGSLYRRDLYAVGGNDEDFTTPGRDDQWFADCLMYGLRLKPVYSNTIVGYHLQHRHILDPGGSREVYQAKIKLARRGLSLWQAASGPWPENTPPPSCTTDSLPV